MVAVTISQYPVLRTETDWFKTQFKSLCSGCTYDELDVSVPDLSSGAVPQKVIGYLQAHPNVNYVFLTFNDLETGLPQALRTAGLVSKVKLTGCCGNPSIMRTIGSGNSAWTIPAWVYQSWVMVDAMARLSVGDTLDPNYLQRLFTSPTWVVGSASSAATYLASTGYQWYGPTGFENQFKKLWRVGP